MLYGFYSCLFHLETFLTFPRFACRPLLRDLEGVEFGTEFVFISDRFLALRLVSLGLISFFKLPNIFQLELIESLLNDLELAHGGLCDGGYFRRPIRHGLVVDESWVIWGLYYVVWMRVVINGAIGNEVLIYQDGISLIVLGLHSQLI